MKKKIFNTNIKNQPFNPMNLFRQTHKCNKNLSMSTTTSNSQNRQNEQKLLKKNSIISSITTQNNSSHNLNKNEKKAINNNIDKELNDSVLEDILEKEGKRIIAKLTESLQPTPKGFIINSKKLLSRNENKDESAVILQNLLSEENKPKILKKQKTNPKLFLESYKTQNTVWCTPPVKIKSDFSCYKKNDAIMKNTFNSKLNQNKNKMIKKKKTMFSCNLSQLNLENTNENIEYLIQNTDGSNISSVNRHLKTSSNVSRKGERIQNSPTTSNKQREKKRNNSHFNLNINKNKKTNNTNKYLRMLSTLI